MRVSAIEIGTNSTKFIIAEQGENGYLKTIERLSTVNRLSKNIHGSNVISEEAMENGLKLINDYINKSKLKDSSLISIFSTCVLRDSNNSYEFIRRVKDLHGIDIDVISGDREAYLAYKACGSLVICDTEKFAVIDIGGGSTEITVGSKNSIDNKTSINMGAVRLTEMFIKNDPIDSEDIYSIRRYINDKIKDSSISGMEGIRLIGTGGTVKTIGTIYLKEDYNNENSSKRNNAEFERSKVYL